MTTVVACCAGDDVIMAADTCTNVYERPIIGGATKLHYVDAGDETVILGLAGHGGLAGVVPALTFEDPPEPGEDAQAWAHGVAMAITQAALEANLVEDGQMDGHLLLGWRGHLWTLVHAMAIPHPDGRAAIGSGEGPAIGALDAFLTAGVPPVDAVRLAAEIACRRDRYSMPPIHLEVLRWTDPVAGD